MHRNYDSSIREELDRADWDEVLIRVFKYAKFRARKFFWLGDKVDPYELVQEAIALAYGVGTGGNYRNWKKKEYPDLAKFLMGIIRSISSHIAEHENEYSKESHFYIEGSPKDKLESLSSPINIEIEFIENENLISLESQIENLCSNDDDLALIVMCLEDGISKPRFIAEETGLDISKVNNLLKRLRRKLDKLNPKMKKNLPKEGGKNEYN